MGGNRRKKCITDMEEYVGEKRFSQKKGQLECRERSGDRYLRNQHIFQQSNIKPKKVIFNSEYLTAKFYNATEGVSNDTRLGAGRSSERKRVTWRPLPKKWLKVNTDVAFQKETGTSAAAMVVRDWQEKIVSRSTTTFKTVSALAAEAQAYREALIVIKNLQLVKCIIESNCLPLLQAIKAKVPVAEVDETIRDILQLLDEAPDVRATWTPREGNNLAHQLATMAAENGLQRQWTVNPPVQVMKIIRTEAGFASLQQGHNIQNLPYQFGFSFNQPSKTLNRRGFT
ncbi:hypothetical protein Ahy_B02g059570 [Arachis hypogaea]|uniref:RNase H type-1 domain-containing protein n=1 Tax=Arachis hypogaea TaxID=3818 RepID=A0A445AGU9_ARAHY|nr:hypothetical protein Ahy_B02g059570 [Arachis hypogaea]